MDKRLIRALVVEFIGTFALIFVGAGAGVMAGVGIGNLVSVALAHGLVIFVMVLAYGHISGTNINPAVTIGLWIAGKTDALKAGLYIVAQLLGAIVGGFLVLWVVNGVTVPQGVNVENALVLGATTLNSNLGVTAIMGVVLEFIATFFLVNSVMNTAVVENSERAAGLIYGRAGNMAGLAIGMTLTFMILFIGPLTGGSLNPARTLGPAIALGSAYPWSEIWVYLVGPILGGLAAGALYRWFLVSPEEQEMVIPARPAAAPKPAAAARSQQSKKR